MNCHDICRRLLDRYGDLGWWPSRTGFAYEVIAGAVLTQNTAWSNVEKAITNLINASALTPEFASNADVSKLAELIRPAGFFNQKARYLKAVTEWYGEYGFDAENVRREPLEKVRAKLLGVKGVGKETADSILLYAFGFPTFVSDAYTVRLCARYPLPSGEGYDGVKAYFEGELPKSAELYNRIHAAIVINAKEHCRKKPLCGGCPLNETCGKGIL